MVNEVLLVENLLQGIGVNKNCLFQHCYLMAKYYLQQGLSPFETRKKIFDWAKSQHIYLDSTTLNVNRLIYKAEGDQRRLHEDEPVRISDDDIREITDRFDTPKVRKVALALLCYAKAFSDENNQFSISITSLCNWLSLGVTQMHASYLKELEIFDYIKRVNTHVKVYSWDGNAKSKSANLQLTVRTVNVGTHELVDNNIDALYAECFE